MNLTKIEVQAFHAAFKSAKVNGHDFGFVEDVVRSLRPLKAQAVGAVITSLSKKGLIQVHSPVTTDSGTFTQFTWTCDQENVRDELMAPKNPGGTTPWGGLAVPSQKKVRVMTTEQLIADVVKYKAARSHKESTKAFRQDITVFMRPLVAELRRRQRDAEMMISIINRVVM